MKILIAALALAFAAMLPQPAHAGQVTPRPVPPSTQVPVGNEVFLVASRRRHPELRLPAFWAWRCLQAIYDQVSHSYKHLASIKALAAEPQPL